MRHRPFWKGQSISEKVGLTLHSMSHSKDMKKVDVSVIIPCYNSNLEWLAECLFSVVQALDAFAGQAEVLVVDDGSKFCIESGVRELMSDQELSRIRFCRKENGGLSSARNFGMQQTRGEWCHFIDDDDLIDEGFYREMMSRTDSGDADLLFSESRFFGEIESQFRIPTADIVSRLVVGNVVHVNAVLARRSTLEQLDGFDEKLNGLEDWDMWLRCVRAGSQIIVVNLPLAAVRIHPASMSTNRPRMNSRMAELSRREWRDHFGFWSSQRPNSSKFVRDGALAGFLYSLRSESPASSVVKMHQILRSQVGVFKASAWLIRQVIKHILVREKSEHALS